MSSSAGVRRPALAPAWQSAENMYSQSVETIKTERLSGPKSLRKSF